MDKVYRCFSEKNEGFQVEAEGVLRQLRESLGISSLSGLRLFNRYDAQGIDDDTYLAARSSVFSESQCDTCYDETLPVSGCRILAVEALPGQYDQRADSCAQCIQLMTRGDKPTVAAAKIYCLYGDISDADFDAIRNYLINPVECREASMDKPDTLIAEYPVPDDVATVEGFTAMDEAGLTAMLEDYGLAMDLNDLKFMQSYYKNDENRDPTVTELRLVDTYWSDHCRHTTFATHIDNVVIEDAEVEKAFRLFIESNETVYGDKAKERPLTLMNIATMGMKALKKAGLIPMLDESEEINACSVHVNATINGEKQDWLLMFKNETHNHPTEIEPFGGAATCIGGAVRDPLSGRSYVYQAMRVTGAGDPTVPMSETLPGKLPQKKLTTTAAAGYSSYGNQLGLATGLVHELYHPGYVAKRMEVGAVVGAAPAENVIRERPEPGDIVVLLGGKTGRDGCGGATGSSKTHTTASLSTCAAEVQKGNAPEERKIQRLFRDPEVSRMIRRCNDFGAGGVSVAIGELADGLSIDLDTVPKKYGGLDGTELAISESQERMAVVIRAADKERFFAAAERENLEATVVATVTDDARMTMTWRGKTIVSLSREFLSSNGADRHTEVKVPEMGKYSANYEGSTPTEKLKNILSSLKSCSQRGLIQRFDSSIGAGSVLMPFGGKTQLTETQVMAALLPAEGAETCSVMSFGFDPYVSSVNPFDGARKAVVSSISKLVAAGADAKNVYLSFQEYFEKLGSDPSRWGKPFAALLGALDAQLGLKAASIGGKDSMSGSFMDMDVPPTLISFAIAPEEAKNVISPEFKAAGNPVCLFENKDIADYDATLALWDGFTALVRKGKVLSGWALGEGCAAEGIFKMSLGNDIGFKASVDGDTLFVDSCGSIIAECTEVPEGAVVLGYTTEEASIDLGDGAVAIAQLKAVWDAKLEPVFPTLAGKITDVPVISSDKKPVSAPKIGIASPLAVIPVFPGTNCEYDTARAVERAGGKAEIIVVRNLSPKTLEESVIQLKEAIDRSQMIIIPGGFSGGDEPDGSGKFIASFFRNAALKDAVHDLLKKRDGLMLGICNGFQALVKLGLVPYGEIRDDLTGCPTLTFNLIGRHQSGCVTTRISSTMSPWLSKCQVGDLHTVPISHGEGRFVASQADLDAMIAGGQIATQYTDLAGNPTMDIDYNPNGSMLAIEGITSPDGRVLGKMGHTERNGIYVGKNIYGEKHQPIFESGVEYFK